MALSARTKIAIVVAGLAGAAGLATGGTALADPGGGDDGGIELVIKDDGGTASTGLGGAPGGHDCPERDGGGTSGGTGGGQAADSR